MPNQHSFTRSQLRNHEFFKAHQKEILEAQARGQIIDDVTTPAPGGAHRTGRRWISGAPDPTPQVELEAQPPAQRAGAEIHHTEPYYPPSNFPLVTF
jgi:hypothetical protein